MCLLGQRMALLLGSQKNTLGLCLCPEALHPPPHSPQPGRATPSNDSFAPHPTRLLQVLWVPSLAGQRDVVAHAKGVRPQVAPVLTGSLAGPEGAALSWRAPTVAASSAWLLGAPHGPGAPSCHLA